MSKFRVKSICVYFEVRFGWIVRLVGGLSCGDRVFRYFLFGIRYFYVGLWFYFKVKCFFLEVVRR